MEHVSWIHKNIDLVLDYFLHGDFNGLINFFVNSNNDVSVSEVAEYLSCSRRSVRRYLKKEQYVPMHIVKALIHGLNMPENLILSAMADDTKTYCRNCLPFLNEQGHLVWYGERQDLINTLFLYRQELDLSLFCMAYKLEIQPVLLGVYESGKRAIPENDVKKICHGLNIKLPDLFPQLYTYDGGKTFVPLGLHKLNADIAELYETSNQQCIAIIPEWPSFRYNRFGQKMMSVMPDELTIDEYYNTDDLFFMKDDWENFWSPPVLPLEKLPPAYFRLHTQFIDKDSFQYNDVPLKYMPQKLVKKIEFLEPYSIRFHWTAQKMETLDLSPYVFSASPWYQMLKDVTYFKKGYLRQADPLCPETQCVLWPDGQYIRIMDIHLDQTPYSKELFYKFKYISRYEGFQYWMQWE